MSTATTIEVFDLAGAECHPAKTMQRYMVESRREKLPIHDLTAIGSRDWDAYDCVSHIQDVYSQLTRAADSHATCCLRLGLLLIQIRNVFPLRTWQPWLRSVGFDVRRAREWQRVAAFFCREGVIDVEKLKALRFMGVDGRLDVSWNRLNSYVRQQALLLRQAQGIRAPGRADSISTIMSMDTLLADVEGDGDDEDEQALPPSAQLDAETLAKRGAAFASSMRVKLRTDNETDILPDPIGANGNTTHVARVGEVPSAGDSGTHAPVQNPGVASDVGGSFRTSGPGETERIMQQATATPRGASGEQATFETYLAEIFRDREEAITEIEAIVAEVHSGALDAAAGRAAMASIRLAAQVARKGAAA